MNRTAPRVVLIGRSALFAEALSRIIEAAGMSIAAAITPTPAGLESLAASDARVAILEASLNVNDTANLLLRIRSGSTLLPIVAGAEWTDEQLVELIEAGCCGSVGRDASVGDLIGAIEDVAHGRAFLSPRVNGLVCARVRTLVREARVTGATASLTPREVEVLRFAAEGKSNKEIAQQLGIWLQTIKSHLHNAYEKLGVKTRREAVARAVRIGVLRDD